MQYVIIIIDKVMVDINNCFVLFTNAQWREDCDQERRVTNSSVAPVVLTSPNFDGVTKLTSGSCRYTIVNSLRGGRLIVHFSYTRSKVLLVSTRWLLTHRCGAYLSDPWLIGKVKTKTNNILLISKHNFGVACAWICNTKLDRTTCEDTNTTWRTLQIFK